MEIGNGITTLVTGAGAVENAWEPIRRMFEEYEEKEFTNDLANCYLAQLIYLRKFFSKEGRDKEALNRIEEQYKLVKIAIADYLQVAQDNGEIREMEELKEILDRFVSLNESPFVLINTNWDTVVDLAIENYLKVDIPKIHIHGSIDYSSSLYLPSEVVEESYREKDEVNLFGDCTVRALEVLQQTKRLILYGISLDPLDAELQIILSYGITEMLQEVIIIDPDYEKVAPRMRLLIKLGLKVRISAYCPSDLNKSYEY